MNNLVVYLDSTAIIKRYVKESGSDVVRKVYVKAYNGEHRISFNLWNIGEVLGVLDRARRINRINDDEYLLLRRRFLLETRRLFKLGILVLVPLKIKILRETWKLIEKHHVYEADAVQIVSAKHVKTTDFLTGDKRLHEIAVKEGLNSTYLG